MAGVPWLCNFPVAAEITRSPYVELHDYLEEHPQEREIVLANLTYFDQLNLADAITCPTIMASSLTDDVPQWRWDFRFSLAPPQVMNLLKELCRLARR